MSKVMISVRGTAQSQIAPEIAIARVAVQFDGAERIGVMAKTSAAGEATRHEVEALAASGAVSEWSSDQLAVWSSRPWNDKGKQLNPVHHASLAFRITFADTTELSTWISSISERDGVRLNGVTWDLTRATRAEIERDTAARAVSEAVERATAYAQAIGRETVTPVQIADTGLLGDASVTDFPAPMMARGASYSGDVEVKLVPEPILVSASVEARFEAE
ncbi:SIMPL domain-containing protein [Actinomycetaceae bacterium L2_0104]